MASANNNSQLNKSGSLKGKAVIASSLLLAASYAVQAEVTDTISKTYNFDSNGRIHLENVNGDVTIKACGCDQVTLNANIKASSQEMRDRITIDISASKNLLKVKTKYKENRGSSWNNQSSEVHYTLSVPDNVKLKDIELVNGDLTINGVTGELHAELVNGSIKSDGMTASTNIDMVNGDINLSFNDISNAENIELESVNGDIEVSLPADASIDVEAETVSGTLSNEFGIEVIKHKYVGSEMRGKTGNGDLRIEMNNVNGRIKLKQI
ncbi:DUF4097 family beta strand repeat-containing protein [Aliikangiella sp. G2MR2-5]|uniref:DUF4097 family beta strand repeat-containing protein n=1 Tax=Aliikangiella sp. G2MR2-5 TaxID=2788943 RepID=UPI0018AA0E32|nr:DUF4097 family beta strand repeat-containing protein [Aliikangiella sp. G2MR2-5]